MSVSMQILPSQDQRKCHLSNVIELVWTPNDGHKPMMVRLSQETMSALIALQPNDIDKKIIVKYYLHSESLSSIAKSLQISENRIERSMKIFRMSLLQAVVALHQQ
ncbi:MAG: hypothetical protein ACOH5I_08020 [Oligoflexus sp.]